MPTMDYKKKAAQSLAHIGASETIHPANKKLIRDYHRHMVLSDISGATAEADVPLQGTR